MFRGREFEIFDEPEPGAAPALGRGTEPPEPEARLSESDEPAATREPNGDPSTAGLWARRPTAMATGRRSGGASAARPATRACTEGAAGKRSFLARPAESQGSQAGASPAAPRGGPSGGSSTGRSRPTPSHAGAAGTGSAAVATGRSGTAPAATTTGYWPDSSPRWRAACPCRAQVAVRAMTGLRSSRRAASAIPESSPIVAPTLWPRSRSFEAMGRVR
jgi:hypothetical protein